MGEEGEVLFMENLYYYIDSSNNIKTIQFQSSEETMYFTHQLNSAIGNVQTYYIVIR